MSISIRKMAGPLLLGALLLGTPVFAAVAPEGNYLIDPDHSHIGFEVSHLGISFVVGRFNKFRGEIKFVPRGASEVNVEIETPSVDTNVVKRDNHLRSADFFEVARFPKMTFVSKRVEYDGDGNPKSIEGELTLHGQKKVVVLQVSPIGVGKGPLDDVRAGFLATATIKRSEFGMTSLLNVAGDDVHLNLNIEAIRQ